jgi:carboxymethylenebutenolidase
MRSTLSGWEVELAQWLKPFLDRLGHKAYGANDRWPGISEVPGVLEPVLTAAGIDHDIKVYADAGHGFLNDHDSDDLSRLDKVIAKLTAARYHAPSARDARTRIIAFLRRHLTDAPSG